MVYIVLCKNVLGAVAACGHSPMAMADRWELEHGNTNGSMDEIQEGQRLALGTHVLTFGPPAQSHTQVRTIPYASPQHSRRATHDGNFRGAARAVERQLTCCACFSRPRNSRYGSLCTDCGKDVSASLSIRRTSALRDLLQRHTTQCSHI